ncbi:hypothetical protein ALTERO38_80064 [Alteromonas sp. 38]|nr:hypothetical protein ALTER154_10547 [Alteromonas sp. 154]VXC41048.1 hypothetical protein ALTERO38_80064 [Alteromonas sp. 38]
MTGKRQFYDNMFQNPINIMHVYKYTMNVLDWSKRLLIAYWMFFLAILIY